MIPEKVFNHEAVVEKRKKMKEKKQRLKERVEGNANNFPIKTYNIECQVQI